MKTMNMKNNMFAKPTTSSQIKRKKKKQKENSEIEEREKNGNFVEWRNCVWKKANNNNKRNKRKEEQKIRKSQKRKVKNHHGIGIGIDAYVNVGGIAKRNEKAPTASVSQHPSLQATLIFLVQNTVNQRKEGENRNKKSTQH